mmetsp:Transcript_139266/g.445177  ORF Transcript_139266/g.445177 Transcript_139266/m.445177 type:complete len:309 (+) Transcript_139266:329-1255(+)
MKSGSVMIVSLANESQSTLVKPCLCRTRCISGPASACGARNHLRGLEANSAPDGHVEDEAEGDDVDGALGGGAYGLVSCTLPQVLARNPTSAFDGGKAGSGDAREALLTSAPAAPSTVPVSPVDGAFDGNSAGDAGPAAVEPSAEAPDAAALGTSVTESEALVDTACAGTAETAGAAAAAAEAPDAGAPGPSVTEPDTLVDAVFAGAEETAGAAAAATEPTVAGAPAAATGASPAEVGTFVGAASAGTTTGSPAASQAEEALASEVGDDEGDAVGELFLRSATLWRSSSQTHSDFRNCSSKSSSESPL